MDFQYKIPDESIRYTGKELRSGWVKERTGLSGDAGVGFLGPCFVPTENLVDMDDAGAGEHIESKLMAHIIIEHVNCPLGMAVLRQRLLVSLLCEILRDEGIDARRFGDDVYIEKRKLTVSIAAPAKTSSLIHLGINVSAEGAPVPACGLDEFGVDATIFMKKLLEAYSEELAGCAHAEEKVKDVP